jgi:hypothetical protein
MPCASTVHGVVPNAALTSDASPTPKTRRPSSSAVNVGGGGRHVVALAALHGSRGIVGAGRRRS